MVEHRLGCFGESVAGKKYAIYASLLAIRIVFSDLWFSVHSGKIRRNNLLREGYLLSDIKLFRFQNNSVLELPSHSVAIEKSLQNLIEGHLEQLLGVRFLASEYPTGPVHGGRTDTLGIDENGSPVIIEYKRSLNENVINQGLFYLDWLLDHKAEFEMLTMKALKDQTYQSISWKTPRLLCIAGNFTKYDEHATKQIQRNIELIRYRKYGTDLLLLEQLTSNRNEEVVDPQPPQGIGKPQKTIGSEKTVSEKLEQASPELLDLYELLSAFQMALGPDVQKKVRQNYVAFSRLKNFSCVEVFPLKNAMNVFVKINPDSITLEPGFTRDVRNIGHFGTGDLEITIRNELDLERAKPLIQLSYENS